VQEEVMAQRAKCGECHCETVLRETIERVLFVAPGVGFVPCMRELRMGGVMEGRGTDSGQLVRPSRFSLDSLHPHPRVLRAAWHWRTFAG
jgi:hypothetical protein